jgi:hypothetical protein
LLKWIQDWKFNATLAPRLDAAEAQWKATQPPNIPPPVLIEHPIDPTVQTGESRDLGGALELKAPWTNQ